MPDGRTGGQHDFSVCGLETEITASCGLKIGALTILTPTLIVRVHPSVWSGGAAVRIHALTVIITALMSVAFSNRVEAAGTYLASGGPVSQSMGGASTAAPLEAIGALYWNPASTSALQKELAVGIGLFQPILDTSSSITGLGSGTSSAEPGIALLPTIGWVHRKDDSPITFGVGVHAIAGYKTNFSSSANPIFAPQSNTPGVPGGLGRVFSGAEFLQMAPTMSLALTDRLSVAAGPTLTLGQLFIDPLLTTPPNDADGSGAPRYSSGRGTRVHWGGGVQLGVYYVTDHCWHLGASIKSPQWMEDFRFKSEDELGRPLVGRAELDLPMIVSVGTAYSGMRDIIVAMDVRYYDYRNTDGWGPHGFNPDGSLRGLGMSSVMELALGGQYRVSDCLYLRAGYTYNQNPFQSAESTFAALAPLFYQHQIHVGMSRMLTQSVSLNLAYSYWPENTLSGPLVTPLGPVPGSSVTSELSVHHLNFGVGVRY